MPLRRKYCIISFPPFLLFWHLWGLLCPEVLPLKLDHQINYHSSLLSKYEWQWMTTGTANFQLWFVIGNVNLFFSFLVLFCYLSQFLPVTPSQSCSLSQLFERVQPVGQILLSCCLQLHCIKSSNKSITFVSQSHKRKMVLGAIIAIQSLPANLWAWLLLCLKKHNDAASLFIWSV